MLMKEGGGRNPRARRRNVGSPRHVFAAARDAALRAAEAAARLGASMKEHRPVNTAACFPSA